MNIEQKSDLSSIVSQKIATQTDGTINGEEVDLQGYESAAVIVVTGTLTDGIHTITLEESDVSGSGFTTVAAGDLVGTPPVTAVTDDDTTFSFSYVGTKRYVRVVSVTSTSSTGGVLGAIVVRGHARTAPVTNN